MKHPITKIPLYILHLSSTLANASNMKTWLMCVWGVTVINASRGCGSQTLPGAGWLWPAALLIAPAGLSIATLKSFHAPLTGDSTYLQPVARCVVRKWLENQAIIW
jgi:hypothetical protein